MTEQAVFDGDDRDERDGSDHTVKVLGWCGTEAAGTVRLFPLDPTSGEVWQGDRLAVLAPFRRQRIGAPLVAFAVQCAAAGGGRSMIAHVQLPNVAFFEHLGWRRSAPVERYVGILHQPMAIDL